MHFYRTVVKVTVGKSQTLYSSVSKKGKDKNNGLLSIGPVNVDIPQHPVALHGMVTRSSKQLSNTLQVSVKNLQCRLKYCFTHAFCYNIGVTCSSYVNSNVSTKRRTRITNTFQRTSKRKGFRNFKATSLFHKAKISKWSYTATDDAVQYFIAGNIQ